MVHVTYIYEKRTKKQGLGGQIRQRGLSRGLLENGVKLREVPLLPPRPGAPELLRFVGIGWPETLPQEPLDDDIVLVAGLPIAFAMLLRSPSRFRRSNIQVDVCDSWVSLSKISPRSSSSRFVSNLRRFGKLVAAHLALKTIGFAVAGVIYISLEDYEQDRTSLGGRDFLIIPNSADTHNNLVGEINPHPDGDLIAIADWAYSPNQAMLDASIEWVRHARQTEDVTLCLIGPGLNATPDSDGIKVVGWVENVPHALNGSLAVLSLVHSGAGVKNKVLEPLMLGIPVIALNESTNGIPECDGLIVADHLSPRDAIYAARLAAAHGFERPNILSWRDSVVVLLRKVGSDPR